MRSNLLTVLSGINNMFWEKYIFMSNWAETYSENLIISESNIAQLYLLVLIAGPRTVLIFGHEFRQDENSQL